MAYDGITLGDTLAVGPTSPFNRGIIVLSTSVIPSVVNFSPSEMQNPIDELEHFDSSLISV